MARQRQQSVSLRRQRRCACRMADLLLLMLSPSSPRQPSRLADQPLSSSKLAIGEGRADWTWHAAPRASYIAD